MLGKTARKYLAHYAEPEAKLASELERDYTAALLVPAFSEDVSLLDGVANAAARAPGRILVIVVVNAEAGAEPAAQAKNAELLRKLRASLARPRTLTEEPARAAWFGELPAHDLLLVDRASPGRHLAEGSGVGLARRMAADVLFALFTHGKLRCPWLGSTDADATLPTDYFETLLELGAHSQDGSRRVGVTFPFWHTPGESLELDHATELYELSLRYYTLGLARAGSPYGYHSLGSALAVHAEAYAEVRGFPRRPAGEDFYLLDKLAKLGAIHRPSSEPIAIRARSSLRVPFGTGPRALQIIRQGQRLDTHSPSAFSALAAVLSALRALARGRASDFEPALAKTLAGANLDHALDPSFRAMQALGVETAVRQAWAGSDSSEVRTRRLLTWFDALRSLRFLHLLEEANAFARLPLEQALAVTWPEALRPAESTHGNPLDLARLRSQARQALFSAETALPADAGLPAMTLKH